MAAPMFDFLRAKQTLFKAVNRCLQSGDGENIQTLEEEFADINGSDQERKIALDEAYRETYHGFITENATCDKWKIFLQIAATSVAKELCSPSTFFMIMSDIFDTITIEQCEEAFTFVEGRIDFWKLDIFYAAGKTYLLRMCNDILRRLSKSQNTVFCGKIQMFLTRLFPLSEKSGLNLMSQFHIENVTLYNTQPEEYDKSRKQSTESEKEARDDLMDMEEGEMDEMSNSIPIDYNLYRKFWALQDFFRKPAQCYEKVPWKTFLNHTDEVLGCFDSFKLDDMKWSKKSQGQSQEALPTHTYFAKYLTSEKLLDLQLSDSNFRRYVLVQFLILFQYLNAPVKFKSPSQVLTDEQTSWVKQTLEKVYCLLRETPPDGAKFAKSIEHVLAREENWNTWKNDGCPSYVRDPLPVDSKPKAPARSRKRSIGEDLKATGGKVIKMGNPELTRLWNLCPNNMEACRAEQRVCLPSMDEYFEEAIEQNDPTNMVEDEYKLIYKPQFQWKALRLLARTSAHFFVNQGNTHVPMPKYLENMISKIAKEMPQSGPSEEVKTEVGEEEEMKEEHADEQIDKQDNNCKYEESCEELTKDTLDQLSTRLDSDWKKLASELNFPEEDVEFLESETDSAKEQALKMLILWQENEADKATPSALGLALREIGHPSIAADILGIKEDPV